MKFAQESAPKNKQTTDLVLYDMCVYIYICLVCSDGHSHVSHDKNPFYFPLYRLVNRDPYFMVHEIIPT